MNLVKTFLHLVLKASHEPSERGLGKSFKRDLDEPSWRDLVKSFMRDFVEFSWQNLVEIVRQYLIKNF